MGILRRGHDDYRKNIFEGIYSKKRRLNVQPKLNRGLAQLCIDFRLLGEVNAGEHEYDLEYEIADLGIPDGPSLPLTHKLREIVLEAPSFLVLLS